MFRSLVYGLTFEKLRQFYYFLLIRNDKKYCITDALIKFPSLFKAASLIKMTIVKQISWPQCHVVV